MTIGNEANETRQRILVATNELFRRQGYNGTSLSQVVKTSGATTGSVYHFFPGGKAELAAEVLRTSGLAYQELVMAILDAAPDLATGMTDAFAAASTLMEETDFIDPCPIGTIAREVASTHDPLRVVANEVMRGWVDALTQLLLQAGGRPDRSAAIASLVITSIEGGFVMTRAARDTTHFREVGEMLSEVVANELANVAAIAGEVT